MVEVGSSPRIVTTKRSVKYRKSSWSVREFEVCSGGVALCRVAVLRMAGSVLLWRGGRAARLGSVALGVPRAGGGALATALLGGAGDADGALALARRLAAALALPAHVCCGQSFDRFTAPLVERGIAAELRAHPLSGASDGPQQHDGGHSHYSTVAVSD